MRKYVVFAVLGLGAAALTGPVHAEDKSQCLMDAYAMQVGEFTNRGHRVNYDGQMSTYDGEYRTEMNEAGVLDIHFGGRLVSRWTVAGEGLTFVNYGEDGKPLGEPVEVAVPLCESLPDREFPFYHFFEVWTVPADPDAEEGSPAAQSWEWRHEHFVTPTHDMTATQVREAGTDGPFMTVSSGLATQKDAAEASSASIPQPHSWGRPHF